MASESRSEEILRALLELSERQARLAASESFEELLECQTARVELFRELKGLDGPHDQTLVNDLLERDKALAALVAKCAVGLKARLERIGKGGRVAKAYAPY